MYYNKSSYLNYQQAHKTFTKYLIYKQSNQTQSQISNTHLFKLNRTKIFTLTVQEIIETYLKI